MRHITPTIRQAVFERDNYTCQYCGACGDDVCLELDHIIPVSRGGNSDIRNLVTACEHCNRSKQDKLISIQELRELAAKIGSTAEYLAGLLDDDDMRILDPNGEKRSEKVMIYLRPSLYADVKDWANLHGKTITDCIVGMIEGYMQGKQEKLALFRELRDNE